VTPADADTSRRGRFLLLGALLLIVVFAAVAVAWVAVVAPENTDVRVLTRDAHDTSFWVPLLVTIVGGLALVALVFTTALRRLRRGEDLYAGRLARRGEST